MSSAPQEVLSLVERYHHNHDRYHRADYNEAQARVDFIDPLFIALGWDVRNERGYDPRYREVEYEPPLRGARAAAGVQAPDYAFRVGPQRKFFVEAKKPAVDIYGDIAPAYQLRSYAWSAKLPLSVLTDFEEFSAYDTTVRPQAQDPAGAARVLCLTYDQYAERWEEIAAVFGREAVLRGDFDRFAESARAKRGTQDVDDAFLAEIEGWRETLARHIALRNESLSVRQINYAVQKIIDRIVFLRFCEDRDIEPYGGLGDAASGRDVYAALLERFRRADLRYNSGLFYFDAEKDRGEEPDAITPALRLDDQVLKEIIGKLYYPASPYRFDVLGAEVLGSVYERFLGSVIRLTPGHRAVVEQKPEVRKAGGVYYTPSYIVEYIVAHTVGALLEGKTPAEVARLRILDAACGSGSFLLGAFQYLLDWHLRYYTEHPGRETKRATYVGAGGALRLTAAEKKRILLNNIYGVDIDPQAVEVTRLSLLLKVLEGESEASLSPQLMPERALPDLASNIKCGNSLIGPDFYQGQQATMFDEEEWYRVNPFDWAGEFPEIMGGGGFDVVIGNPPYIRIQNLKEFAPKEVKFYKGRYAAASKGNYDIYVVFVEKGLSLLNERGRLGFILPHKFFNAQYGEPLRRLLSEGRHLSEIVHFGDQQVFEQATTYTCLLFLCKAGCEKVSIQKVNALEAWIDHREAESGVLPAPHFTSAEWNLVVGDAAKLFSKLKDSFMALGQVATIFVGLQTSADSVFILDLVAEDSDSLRLHSKALARDWDFEKGLFFPLVSGTDVNRYAVLPERQFVLFPYYVDGATVGLIPLAQIRQQFPKTAAYILENRAILEGRERGRMKGPSWYGYIYLKNMTKQQISKVCVPRLVDRLYAAYDASGQHFLDNVDVGGVVWQDNYTQHGLSYLLSLLNSRLLRWYFPFVSAPFRGGWLSANRQFLSQLPIRLIDFTSPADVARYDRMVALVERMLALHKELAGAGAVPGRAAMLRAQIALTDREIDALVYELYGLTEEEIRIVEGG